MNRNTLQNELETATGCAMQHDGWPCGTCFFAMGEGLTNQDWQAVLVSRGDYKAEDMDNLPNDIAASLDKVLQIAQNAGK